MPELSLSVDEQRVRGSVIYRLEHYEILDASELSSTIQLGAANATFIVAPEFLNLEVNANRYQQLLQPERPVNIENFFTSGNAADTVSWTIAPVLARRVGSTTVQARYEVTGVQYDLPALVGPLSPVLDRPEDTDLRQFSAEWGTREEDSRLPWFVRYNSDRAEYDVAPPYSYEAVRVGAGYELSSTLMLSLEIGRESDLTTDSTVGGLNSDVALVRAKWHPGSRTQAEIWAGSRFFGTTYGLRLSRHARQLRLDVSYAEEPTTVGEQAQRFSPIGPDSIAPGQPRQDQQRLGSSAFLLKSGEVQATLDGRRTNIKVRGFSDTRDYFGRDAREEYYGADVSVMRRLSPDSTFQLTAAWATSNFVGGGSRRDTRLNAVVTRRLSRSVTGALELGRYQGKLVPDITLESWYGFMRLTYEFDTARSDATSLR